MNSLVKVIKWTGMLPLLLTCLQAVLSENSPGLESWIFATVFIACAALGARFVENWERKALANLIIIDLKPNQVIVDGAIFDSPFSSETHFFASRKALSETVRDGLK